MLGLPLEDMNNLTQHFFYDCFARLAREVKSKENYERMKEILMELDLSDVTRQNDLNLDVSM